MFPDNHLVLSQYSRYTGEYRLEVAVFEGGGQTDGQTESRQEYRAYASQSYGKNCVLPSILAVRMFAACVEERSDIPCVKDIDTPSQRLLRAVSISHTGGV